MKAIKKLGEGSFGEVWLFEKEAPKFAVKILKDKSKEEDLIREAEILHILSYKNSDEFNGCNSFIVCSYGIQNTSLGVGLVMEYLSGYTLEDIYEKYRDIGVSIQPKNLYIFMYHIFQGLKYMHSKGIVHRDIKDSNIMFSDTKIKIIDMGFACKYKNDSSSLQCLNPVGSPLFLAPEMYVDFHDYDAKPPTYPPKILKNMGLLKKADVWAAGAICWELISLNDPPNPENVHSQNDMDKFAMDIKTKTHSWLLEILSYTMKYDPKKRSSAKNIVKALNQSYIVKKFS